MDAFSNVEWALPRTDSNPLMSFDVGAALRRIFGQREPMKADTSLAPRRPEEETDISVYRKASQAIVFINTLNEVRSRSPLETLFGLRSQMVPGLGSGVIIDAERGVIVTNLHVIENASKVSIKLGDDKEYSAKLLGVSASSDLAVLQLENPPPGLSSVPLGDSSLLEVGQHVLAIGNPLGLDRTLTTGIISGPPRDVQAGPGGLVMRGLIQTDAAINPGNSGGALIDSAGRLIGINNMIMTTSGGSQGLGFAIPVSSVVKVVNELIETGRVTRPYVGLSFVDSSLGPVVDGIDPKGPAYRAGLRSAPREQVVRTQRGSRAVVDPESLTIITAVNGIAVKSAADVEMAVAEAEPGESLTFSVRLGAKDSRSAEIRVEPERVPDLPLTQVP